MDPSQRSLTLRTALLLGGLFLYLTPVPAAFGQAGETDVDALIEAMTLEEKLVLLHGAQDPTGEAGAGYVPGIPRLGIPALRMADGPAGIRTTKPATALPAPVALSATFDPDLAHRFGQVIGHEGRARNQDVLLSPMVNIVRVPHGGRNFETFGEDPLLAGRLVAEEIRGIEGEGLIATVKHYAANNFEQDRMNINAEVDERALHEIYLPGFEAAINAGVGSVMCAYNKVNGTFACENEELLTDILRDRFGFNGWVMTDWFARHSLGALEAGLDQEMPGLSFGPMQAVFFGDSLRVAVEAGRIPEAAVDQAVRRILTQMDRMELLGGTVTPRPELDVEAGAAVARDVAMAGAVLLRNEQGTLPLTANDLTSLVVIGPTAKTPLYGGGGSSHVLPLRLENLLDALQRQTGSDATIRYVAGIDLDGLPIPAAALAPAGTSGDQGLLRTAADGTTRVDAEVNYIGEKALPTGTSWTWSGTFTAPVTGDYALKVQSGGGPAQLRLDGETVLSTGGFFSDASLIRTSDGLQNATAMLHLEADASHEIVLTAGGRGFGFMAGGPSTEPLQVRLAWVTPVRRQAFLDEAAEAAGAAQAAVVLAYDEGTEGTDRPSLALPGGQDELVSKVTRANPRTTVVLNTGDPVLMPWVEQAGAVLQMWYPGQEGADATAALLLGTANPGGKLPVTFPKQEDETPVHDPQRYPGVEGTATYGEGILVGYRWYDAREVEPLFAFGHGLSYTTFAYDNLTVTPNEEGYDVTFDVRNTGNRAGVEVPQVYLGAPSDPPVVMAPKQLVGFKRIDMEPGEARTMTIHIGPRALSYWSTDQHDWVVATGVRPVYVGSSSREIRLQGELTVAN